jgi:hypothetical protein
MWKKTKVCSQSSPLLNTLLLVLRCLAVQYWLQKYKFDAWRGILCVVMIRMNQSTQTSFWTHTLTHTHHTHAHTHSHTYKHTHQRKVLVSSTPLFASLMLLLEQQAKLLHFLSHSFHSNHNPLTPPHDSVQQH